MYKKDSGMQISTKIENIVGFSRNNSEGYPFTVIGRLDGYIVLIEWPCGQRVEAHYSNALTGGIKYYNHRGVQGVGYLGYGKFKHRRSLTDEGDKPFDLRVVSMWESMLERAYSDKYNQPQSSYFGTKVEEIWHSCQNFSEWVEGNRLSNLRDFNGEVYQLDKDILIPKNKTYSPDTCCFVPRELNSFFRNSYKSSEYGTLGVHKRGKGFRSSCRNPVTGKHMISVQRDSKEEAQEDYIKNKTHIAKLLSDKWDGLIEEGVAEILRNFSFEEYFLP